MAYVGIAGPGQAAETGAVDETAPLAEAMGGEGRRLAQLRHFHRG